MKIKLLNSREISKKYPSSSRGTLLLSTDNTLWLPCEALGLNWQLGGGIPFGKMCEVFGYESTGKSLLAYGFGKCCQQLGGVLLWADAEFAFMPEWAEQNGIDLEKTEVYEGNDVEGISDWARDMCIYYRSILTHNEPIVLVVDSIAALETDANINSDDKEGKAQMGNRAKALYQFYRKRMHLFKQLGITVIMINQVRKKLGASMFESNETQPGGESTKFYASQRIGLSAGKQIKGVMTTRGFKDKSDGIKYGRTVYVQIVKNKVAPPRSNIKTQVHFLKDILGYTGYHRYAGLHEILLAEDVITKKGSRFYFGEHMICNGEDAFYEWLVANPKKRAMLISKSSINTVSKTKSRMESININLFPVKVRNAEEDSDE